MKNFTLIFFIVLGYCAFAQNMPVTGTVVDANKVPIMGVSIIEKGTQNGTTTDFDGKFSLSLKKSPATLILSYVGFKSVEEPASSGGILTITLKEDVSQLNEVVVIGYGAQQRKDLTGSVATIQSKEIEDIPVASVDQKLAGQIPGVQISTVTGTPGGSAKINIRGIGSIGANSDPLIVIDGFPISSSFNQTSNPLNLLNPDDIASISVLKDASSTAIYGSRGANGVIIIETKQGKAGKLQIDLNTYASIQQVPQKGRPDLLNARQFAQFQKEIREDAAIANGGTAGDAVIPEMYKNPEQYGKGTNWYNAILQTAPMQSINLNVRGGSQKLRGMFSLGYLNQEGTIRYTGYKRYSIRTNLQANLGDKITMGVSLSPTFSKQKLSDSESDFVDVVGSSQWLNPIIPIYDEDGNRTPFIGGDGLYQAPNPLNRLEFNSTNVQNFRGIASAFAKIDIFKNFNAKYTYTADITYEKRSQFTPSFLGGTNNPPPIVPSSYLSRSDVLNQSSEVLLNYNAKINDDNLIDVTAGFSTQKERSESVSLSATDYPDDEVETINAAGRISGYGQDVQEWALVSYFARLNYNYKSKYLLTATVRSDGSSRFGDQNRYGTFPSVGAAWRISEESFMKKTFINNLKLRASYGLSGNFNIGNYTYVATVGSSDYVLGDSRVSGRAINSLGKPNLTWEESKQLDIGIEGSVFNNRLSFNIDYYRRNTNNMLIDTQIPSSSGYSSATINGGDVLNKGLEIALNSVNFNGDFKWTTGFNIAFNRNKVLSLEGDSDYILSGRSGEGNPTHITKVGAPVGQFYGYVVEGVYMNEEDFENSPKHSSSVLGSIKYKDVNGDGVIEAVNDFDVIGSPYPNFTFGITNTFNYKNFDLSLIIDGQQGGELLVGANQFLDNIDGIFNVTTKVLNRWRSPENPGDGKTPTTNGGRVIYRDVNSSWVEDASFLRMRNITLGYNMTSLFSKNSFITNARIYTSITNAFTLTSYSRGNPQVASSSNRGGGSLALAPGLDFTSYPLARTYTLGLNLSF
ncbi:SusC/RagA family TonB-linked outer membrane protein [Zhouia sp. PK063]|uniref:SusC/RagA family TonB-linked outer membrane protein n=1 Tax=Zhouia sp. PK063 TaxID=3373602 RepID=UPI0037AFC6EC